MFFKPAEVYALLEQLWQREANRLLNNAKQVIEYFKAIDAIQTRLISEQQLQHTSRSSSTIPGTPVNERKTEDASTVITQSIHRDTFILISFISF